LSIIQYFRFVFSSLVYADTQIPQEFTISLREPQSEIVVWLHGMGAPRDVTQCYTTACCDPLLIGVAFSKSEDLLGRNFSNAALHFCEREGQKRMLGQIRLRRRDTISFDQSEFIVFSVRGSNNYCLPRLRLWAHDLPKLYSYWRRRHLFDVNMNFTDIRASLVMFIRPHPFVLGSVMDSNGGNIFPMNLLNPLGDGYFGFALKESRLAAHLVEDAGYIAISSVPESICASAFALAINHTKDHADWAKLSFKLKESSECHIPIPMLSSTVRELKVVQVHKLGSHNFFIAKVLSDQRRSNEAQVHIVHGFYQHWRLRSDKKAFRISIARDAMNKGRHS
jgi:flavin reductase (DIM6/NTAB) family NADH-FMN oxidoreductase RutF